jgi:hypothetical protein
MFYRLLGMAAWHGAKLSLRRRYGRGGGSAKSVLAAGGVVAVGLGLAAVLMARRGGAES